MQHKLVFSGHETFHCKNLWLKKGFDFVNKDGKFTDDACVELGVGRNMVNSIRFWLKSFNIIDLKSEKTTKIAEFIFNDKNGKDIYIEDETTLWLFHYLLISNNFSSIYSFVFNEFRKIKPEFDKNNFISFLSERRIEINQNTIGKDFGVFLRIYQSKKNDKDKEDSFSGILSDLDLLHEINKAGGSKYFIKNTKQQNIPEELILFIILENDKYGKSISFKNLYSDFDSVGNIFAFSKDNLEDKLIKIAEKYSTITYSNEAGIKELQFKGDKPNSLDVLSAYYDQN